VSLAGAGVLACLLACLLAFLTACSGSTGSPNRPAPASPTSSATAAGSPPAATSSPPASDPAALARFYHQQLQWTACQRLFQCATAQVPLSYSDPAGPTITLALARLPASDPAQRIGSLLVNPGGPGGSGKQFVLAAATLFPAAIRARFDIVGFDPRGVGESTPIRCLSAGQLDQYVAADPEPSTAAQISSVVAVSRMFAAGCQQRSGRLLAHVSTLDEARDMDVLRAALGDSKLTYLGFSYGTYLGAKYIQLFPTHVRAMVLDGAVDPSLGLEQLNRTQAEGFQLDLEDFIRSCVSSGRCPLGSSVSQANQTLGGMVVQIQNHPVPGAGGRLLESGEFFNGLADALYDPAAGWPVLQQALADVEQGSGTIMLELSDQLTGRQANGQYTNELEANVAINCIDRPSPRRLATYEQDAKSDARVAPFFGAAIDWGSLTCAYWPVPAVEAPHPVHNPGPATILVVGTTRDPATPYAWAKALTAQLGRAMLLSYNNDGHTAYLRGSSCIDSAVDAYLISLQLPAPGTLCN
jgi:pimeloyl-ACP methyl ester carboxylesterase